MHAALAMRARTRSRSPIDVGGVWTGRSNRAGRKARAMVPGVDSRFCKHDAETVK